MNRILFILLLFFSAAGCSYEPIMSNKNYDFYFKNLETQGDGEINEIISSRLLKNKGNKPYNINLKSKKTRNIISSNLKGDPTVFQIIVISEYIISNDDQNILSDKIEKRITYNNINDKFELDKYEDNLIRNLSINISDEILTYVKSINK